jgi:hypothetical protein
VVNWKQKAFTEMPLMNNLDALRSALKLKDAPGEGTFLRHSGDMPRIDKAWPGPKEQIRTIERTVKSVSDKDTQIGASSIARKIGRIRCP